MFINSVKSMQHTQFHMPRMHLKMSYQSEWYTHTLSFGRTSADLSGFDFLFGHFFIAYAVHDYKRGNSNGLVLDWFARSTNQTHIDWILYIVLIFEIANK